MSKGKYVVVLSLVLSGSWVYAKDTIGINATVTQPMNSTSEAKGGTQAIVSNDQSLANGAPTAEETLKVASTSKPGNVTLDFRDADLVNVLRVLSYKGGVNIVPTPEVSGLVTIQLNDVPWEQALNVILDTYGYGYERKGSIIIVTTIEDLKKRRENAKVLAEQEPLATKTFLLSYAKAVEVISSIEKMKTSRGNINFDARTNTIIVRDIQSNIDLISQIIPVLDAVTPQVLIEGKIVETTLSNTEKLGIDWTAKASLAGPKRPTTFPFEKETSKYISDAFPAAASSLFSYGTIDFTTLQSVMEFLKSRSDTNILSNPSIVTLDNHKASINVGTQYPIPTYTFNEQTAKLQVSGWNYMDIGIIFEVTPHVNNTGFVTLDLTPKVSAILDFVTVENTSLPRLSNESAATRVMIKNGDTLVIAGLIKDQTTDTKKKVPILGDIPVAGLIFRKNSTVKEKTELLIFMTPHIVTSDKQQAANSPHS